MRSISRANSPKPVYPVSEDKDIFNHLRQDVGRIIKQLEPKFRREIIFKAIFFPLAYFFIYTSALVWGHDIKIFYACYFLMGLFLVFIFLNVIHDAVHGSIFKSNEANRMYFHLFDLMGANSFIWQLRHVRFHHNYPNVNGWDTDLEQSNIARVFPDADYLPLHKYQHIYLPLLYPFYLPNWLLIRDFKDFFNKKKPVHKLVKIPAMEYVKLFFFKLVFLFYMIFIPKIILDITWLQGIIAFAIFLLTASIFSLAVLLSPHANTTSHFPLPDKNNRLPDSWMMHMMLTTNDITHNNFFTRFFMGCFNFHVAHHLFPNVNHLYYPGITACLKQYARRYDLPYREYSLFTSLKNHYMLLKQNRVQENLFEETM